MTKYILTLVLALIAVVIVGCGTSSEPSGGSPTAEDTGILVLKLADAPVDDENIAGVYIAINRIEVNKATDTDAGWTTVKELGDPLEYNLLELTGGNFALLGEFELTAGHYNQIRFMLDIQEHGKQPPTTPGSYVRFTDESTQPLFVPSGGQSGYKAVGSFEVPVNSEVEVTVDFDLRKALHVTGHGNNQRYILRPTLRLLVDSQSGSISGTIALDTAYTDIIVFAYEDGDWDISEADAPAEGELRFPNAVSSARMNDDGIYVLAYLAYGTYELVVVGYNGETFGDVLGTVSGVLLDSNQTLLNIGTDDLEAVE